MLVSRPYADLAGPGRATHLLSSVDSGTREPVS